MLLTTETPAIPETSETVANGMLRAGLLWAVRPTPNGQHAYQVLIISGSLDAAGTARVVSSLEIDDLYDWTAIANTPLADLTRPGSELPISAEDRAEIQRIVYLGAEGEFDVWRDEPEPAPVLVPRPARMN